MPDTSTLSKDEKRIISELTDKLIQVSDEAKINRAELFSRLSALVSGVKLGLINNEPAPAV